VGQQPEDIERHIHETRARLDDNVAELRESIRSRLDWRRQLQSHPLAGTATAFAVGLTLSLLLGRARTSARRRARSRRLVAEFAGGRARIRAGAPRASWNELIETLIALGPDRVRALFSELLPAFRQYAARR
jgi:hypothetical protein